MIPTRLIASGIHILAIVAMSAYTAFLFNSSLMYERWLSDVFPSLLLWDTATTISVSFAIFSGVGLLLSLIGRRPGLFALIPFLFFLPSLYANSSLDWLQFADLDVEPNITQTNLVSLGVVMLTGYVLIRMVFWMSDAEQDLRRRGVDAGEVREALLLSLVILLVTLGIATGAGLALAFSAEPIGEFLQSLMRDVPFSVLTVGIVSAAAMAWAIGRLVSRQPLVSRSLWRWRR